MFAFLCVLFFCLCDLYAEAPSAPCQCAAGGLGAVGLLSRCLLSLRLLPRRLLSLHPLSLCPAGMNSVELSWRVENPQNKYKVVLINVKDNTQESYSLHPFPRSRHSQSFTLSHLEVRRVCLVRLDIYGTAHMSIIIHLLI